MQPGTIGVRAVVIERHAGVVDGGRLPYNLSRLRMADSSDDPLRRYQVMEPLGHGGSGRTFRAVDRQTARQVAVKVLSLHQLEDWKRFDLFEREASVLATLDHPGIPRYIDRFSSEASGDYFLVMELIDGTALSKHIHEGRRMTAATLTDMLEQGLRILDYLHTLSPPVIHRDIKPANLLLDHHGVLHLVDFGGVRMAALHQGGSTIVGSFGYMAPEQLHGDATPATDLYALGASIAALHAGAEADTLPHDGLHIDLPTLSLPPAIAPALARMLEPDPKHRVRSVAEVRALLQKPPPKTPAPPPRAAAAPTTTLATPPKATTSLAPMEGVRALAQVPAPLSVLIWIISGLAAGGLTIMQVVLLPLVFHIARHIGRNRQPDAKARMEGELADIERTVVSARRSFSYVAGQTNPIGDDDEPKSPSKKQ